ncbi:hypothetical protein GCM10010967_38030 [Dyadobacter beijingensis]|uniref:Methyltransferase domain-containing protein n=1 Tax=Dyadobacter beijingensis TaxID=365489 RepID=A0ABQ2I6M2_9BACT|nr:class I SAM-dependent methyltransferase [Dyadobacter beijingensis]GGN00230.1 hypothetical protein GCM10010967_38030 [Dyadobacter beijingensis]
MVNNYDRIARYYDRLSRLIFGKAIVRAQQSLLGHIGPPGRMLIVGGGTGWILEEIARRHGSGLVIDYVEISGNMLARSRRRNTADNEVRFVHSGVEDFVPAHRYDAVVTPFLFDNFAPVRAEAVFQKLDDLLLPGGQWLFADFNIEQNGHAFWQKLLLRAMYVFFRTISQVEARELPDMKRLFAQNGYTCKAEYFQFARFIRSAVYKRARRGQ